MIIFGALIFEVLLLISQILVNTQWYLFFQLLKQVRERNVTMNPEATLLIKKYFVASRRARMNEMLKGAEMPLKALQTM